MGRSHDLFLECFSEVRRSFPGSTAKVLKEMAERLHEEVSPESRPTESQEECFRRCHDLKTALQTLPDWPGLRPGDPRPINAA